MLREELNIVYKLTGDGQLAIDEFRDIPSDDFDSDF